MSEHLKTLLRDQAASVDFRPTDLQTIRRKGHRRIARRRSLVALAGVAVTAVTVGSVALFGPSPDRSSVTQPGPTGAAIWATGSTIHDGPDTIEVGHVVRAFVYTSVGFVVADEAGDVYSVTAQAVTLIGHLSETGPDKPRLVSDSQGSLVGWVADSAAGTLELQTYDQATEAFLAPRPVAGAVLKDELIYRAIDGRTGYFVSAAGLSSVDLDTGTQTLLRPATAQPTYELGNVENGLLVLRTGIDDAGEAVVLVGPSIEDAEEVVRFPASTGPRQTQAMDPIRLSPTGDWLAVTAVSTELAGGGDNVDLGFVAVQARIYDTATGEQVALDLPATDPPFVVGSVWLTSTTLQVLTIDGLPRTEPEQGTVQAAFYTCSVVSGACALAVDLGSFVIGGDNPSEPPVAPDGNWWE